MNAFHGRRDNALTGTLTDVSGCATIGCVMDEAGLDWDVTLHEVQYRYGGLGSIVTVPGQYAVARDLTTPLGVVGQRYTPIQNRDAFAPLAYLEAEGFIDGYEQAGVLGDGQKVFVIARLAEEMRLHDKHHGRILFSTSHDGSGAFSVRAMVNRLFCANQIPNLSRVGSSLGISIKHTQSAEQRIARVKHMVMAEMQWIREYEDVYSRLLDQPMTLADQRGFVDILAPVPSGPKATDRMIRAGYKKQQDIHDRINGHANRNIAGTWAAAFQGAVEYSDYDARGNNAERILLGRDLEFKREAWDLTRQMAFA